MSYIYEPSVKIQLTWLLAGLQVSVKPWADRAGSHRISTSSPRNIGVVNIAKNSALKVSAFLNVCDARGYVSCCYDLYKQAKL